MIVVLPVPPAPIKRHACCARFRKGILLSSSCQETSIASPSMMMMMMSILPLARDRVDEGSNAPT